MKSLSKNSWILLLGALLPWASAFAEEATKTVSGPAGWAVGIGAGFGIGVAVLGAALGQGKIGAAFMDGVSRNPGAYKSMFTPLIIGLAFVETLVLFSVLIVFTLLGKVGTF
jgi:F-type H+-transporting ATPase subunit c